MEVYSWSNGDKFERSLKKDKPILNNKNEIIDNLRSTKYESRKNNSYNEGYIINRASQNPFFENKNYINVSDDQVKYLTPLNSNFVSSSS